MGTIAWGTTVLVTGGGGGGYLISQMAVLWPFQEKSSRHFGNAIMTGAKSKMTRASGNVLTRAT